MSRADLRPRCQVEWGVRAQLQDAGIRVVQTPYRAPNANAYAERFVRSIKEECLDRLIPFGERHFRRAVAGHLDDHRAEALRARVESQVLTPGPPGHQRTPNSRSTSS